VHSTAAKEADDPAACQIEAAGILPHAIVAGRMAEAPRSGLHVEPKQVLYEAVDSAAIDSCDAVTPDARLQHKNSPQELGGRQIGVD
jgi:hypothetical protein